MIANPKFHYMTPQEYLQWEEQQPIKYEYIDCYRLNEKNKWELTHYQIDETTTDGMETEIYLTSVDFCFPISLLYSMKM